MPASVSIEACSCTSATTASSVEDDVVGSGSSSTDASSGASRANRPSPRSISSIAKGPSDTLPSHTCAADTSKLGSSRSCARSSTVQSSPPSGSRTRRHKSNSSQRRRTRCNPLGNDSLERAQLLDIDGSREPRITLGQRVQPRLGHRAAPRTADEQTRAGVDEPTPHERVDCASRDESRHRAAPRPTSPRKAKRSDRSHWPRASATTTNGRARLHRPPSRARTFPTRQGTEQPRQPVVELGHDRSRGTREPWSPIMARVELPQRTRKNLDCRDRNNSQLLVAPVAQEIERRTSNFARQRPRTAAPPPAPIGADRHARR